MSQPGEPTGAPRPWSVLAMPGAIAVAVAALGAPFGLVWAAVAPEVPVRVTERGPIYGEAQPEQLIAADGWFAILAVPFGMLLAAGVWLIARRARGTVGLVSLTAGAVAAGLVAWWLGRNLGLADYQSTLAAADTGARLDRPPDLGVAEVEGWPPQVFGVLLVPALAAAATYTMVAAWSRFPSLRPEPPAVYPPVPPPPAAYPPVPPAQAEPPQAHPPAPPPPAEQPEAHPPAPPPPAAGPS